MKDKQDIRGETKQQDKSKPTISGLELEPGLINTSRDAQSANKIRTSHTDLEHPFTKSLFQTTPPLLPK
jgi:hypothetical protein